MNRPILRDLRKPPWLTAGAVVVLAGGLVAVGDSPASGMTQTTVLRGNVTATASAAGTVRSADTRDLVFATSGGVTRIEVAPGDTVKAGDVLARLDDSEAKDQVAVAKAALAAADDTYAKAREGICTGGASGGGTGGSGGAGGGSGSGSGGTGGGSAEGAAAAEPASYQSGPVRRRRPPATPTPTPTPTPTRTTPTPRPTVRPTSRPTVRPTPTHTPTSPKPTPTHSPTTRPKPTGGPGKGGGRSGGGRSGGRSGGGGLAAGGRGGGGRGGAACQANAVELASASVTESEVKEREAERTLAATELTAPMDGTVLSVGGTVGAEVTGQSRTGFITLGDLDALEVQAMFPLGEVDQLKIGRPAMIGLGMLAGRTYRGTVTRIDPAATTSGNRALYGVMISLDEEPPAGLRTGMSATAQVVTAQADSTLYVPAGAVHPKPGGLATILIRHDGRTVVRTVRTGVRGDRYVAVTSGLTAGDHVVMPTTTGTDGFPSDAFPGT